MRNYKKKVGILGCKGQIGNALTKELKKKFNLKNFDRNSCNLISKKSIKNIFKKKFDILINAAAFTDVEKCEKDKTSCKEINTNSLILLSKMCFEKKILFVHFSTDYVFDGKKKIGYTEDDVCNPLSFYGKTKLLGEKIIKESGCNYLILRTSWVYGPNKKNFVNTIINKIKDGKDISVVNDQFGTPNSSVFIAKAVKRLILKNHKKKIFNISCNGKTSWFNFAKQILKELGHNYNFPKIKIGKTKTINTNYVAKRPLFSKLSNKRLRAFDSNFKIYSWQYYLKRYISNSKNFNVK